MRGMKTFPQRIEGAGPDVTVHDAKCGQRHSRRRRAFGWASHRCDGTARGVGLEGSKRRCPSYGIDPSRIGKSEQGGWSKIAKWRAMFGSTRYAALAGHRFSARWIFLDSRGISHDTVCEKRIFTPELNHQLIRIHHRSLSGHCFCSDLNSECVLRLQHISVGGGVHESRSGGSIQCVETAFFWLRNGPGS